MLLNSNNIRYGGQEVGKVNEVDDANLEDIRPSLTSPENMVASKEQSHPVMFKSVKTKLLPSTKCFKVGWMGSMRKLMFLFRAIEALTPKIH